MVCGRRSGEIKRSRSTRSEHRMNMNEFEKAGRWQFSQRPAFVTFLGIIIILQFGNSLRVINAKSSPDSIFFSLNGGKLISKRTIFRFSPFVLISVIILNAFSAVIAVR